MKRQVSTKSLTLFLLLFCATHFAFSQDKREEVFKLSISDRDGADTSGNFSFRFFSPDKTPVNSENCSVFLDDVLQEQADVQQGVMYCRFDPGVHTLRIETRWFNSVRIDSLVIAEGKHYAAEIHFVSKTFVLPEIHFEYDKPVIYLYPETPTEIEVKLHFDGQLGFTWPSYENGWKVNANPNGELFQHDKAYRYLFWEGASPVDLSEKVYARGNVVKKEQVPYFLDSVLTIMGLNSFEKQDFITYWVPQLISSQRVYLHFLEKKEYRQIARLEVVPEPDREIRIFMCWRALQEEEEMTLIVPQQFEPEPARTGFTLVEWGGARIPFRPQ